MNTFEIKLFDIPDFGNARYVLCLYDVDHDKDREFDEAKVVGAFPRPTFAVNFSDWEFGSYPINYLDFVSLKEVKHA